jgi:hypothetical protein
MLPALRLRAEHYPSAQRECQLVKHKRVVEVTTRFAKGEAL